MQIYVKNRLPVSIRYRIFSLCHSIGSIAISTPTLLVANYIWTATGSNWLCFFCPCAFFAALLMCTAYIAFRAESL
jgi:hypothetical protein